MKITINTPSEIKQTDFAQTAIGYVTKTLGRFSHRITSVSIALTDLNGPRGGVDQECRVTIVMPGCGPLSTSAVHENPVGAVTRAADRARRMVVTKLRRPQALRVRRRKNGAESSAAI